VNGISPRRVYLGSRYWLALYFELSLERRAFLWSWIGKEDLMLVLGKGVGGKKENIIYNNE